MLLLSKLARVADFCVNTLCSRFPSLLRKMQSKGHGVHSPFAFNLITKVIYSPYSFYAYSDIYDLLAQHNINPEVITAFNQLSYRLVHFLQPETILEINSGSGINTLFLHSSASHIKCTCVESDYGSITVAEHLNESTKGRIEWVNSLEYCEGMRYNAIFVNLQQGNIPDIDMLISMSHSTSFWVFYPIHQGASKQYWSEIVHDVKVRVTFDVKETGIVFLKPDLHKQHYLL